MTSTSRRRSKTAQDDRSLQAALWALFMGVVALITTFVVVAVRWKNESGVAALAAVASSIAAILSGYFSIQYSADRRRR